MSVEEIINKYPAEKSYLLMILQEIQDSSAKNYIPENALHSVASYLNMTMSSIYGVVSYYSMLSLKPRGKYIVRVCNSPVCELMDDIGIMEWLEDFLGIKSGETTCDGLFTIEATECLGRCAKAPSIMINNETYTNINCDRLKSLLSELQE